MASIVAAPSLWSIACRADGNDGQGAQNAPNAQFPEIRT